MNRLLNRIGLGRKDLRAWAMYDWANSAFQTTVIAAIFPIYYVKVAAADLPDVAAQADADHRAIEAEVYGAVVRAG